MSLGKIASTVLLLAVSLLGAACAGGGEAESVAAPSLRWYPVIFEATPSQLLRYSSHCDESPQPRMGDIVVMSLEGLPRPNAIRRPLPTMPPDFAIQGQAAKVVLEVRIGRLGNVEEAKVKTSSGYPEFDAAAVAAVGDWLYESPIDRCGNLCEVIFPITITYRASAAAQSAGNVHDSGPP